MTINECDIEVMKEKGIQWAMRGGCDWILVDHGILDEVGDDEDMFLLLIEEDSDIRSDIDSRASDLAGVFGIEVNVIIGQMMGLLWEMHG